MVKKVSIKNIKLFLKLVVFSFVAFTAHDAVSQVAGKWHPAGSSDLTGQLYTWKVNQKTSAGFKEAQCFYRVMFSKSDEKKVVFSKPIHKNFIRTDRLIKKIVPETLYLAAGSSAAVLAASATGAVFTLLTTPAVAVGTLGFSLLFAGIYGPGTVSAAILSGTFSLRNLATIAVLDSPVSQQALLQLPFVSENVSLNIDSLLRDFDEVVGVPCPQTAPF